MSKHEEDKFAELIARLTPANLVDVLLYARRLLASQQAQRKAATMRRAKRCQTTWQKTMRRDN